MKLTLEFNNEEYVEAQQALLGPSLSFIIWDLHQWLREQYKYEKGEIPSDTAQIVQKKLTDIMEEYSIDFNNIIFN